MTITPGVQHQQREAKGGPSDHGRLRAAVQIACYKPSQIQQAYNLPALFSRGITGKGATIVVMDPYGSPTIGSDLSTFDRAVRRASTRRRCPSSGPGGKVRGTTRSNATMVGWAGETTLDVEYAHVMAPGAKIVVTLSRRDERQRMPSSGRAVRHQPSHRRRDQPELGDDGTGHRLQRTVRRPGRRLQHRRAKAHITVLSAESGDSGAPSLQGDEKDYYTFAHYPVARRRIRR